MFNNFLLFKPTQVINIKSNKSNFCFKQCVTKHLRKKYREKKELQSGSVFDRFIFVLVVLNWKFVNLKNKIYYYSFCLSLFSSSLLKSNLIIYLFLLLSIAIYILNSFPRKNNKVISNISIVHKRQRSTSGNFRST